MRFNAELHTDVLYDLKHTFAASDVSDFWRQLERVRADPIKRSRVFADPGISKYALRWFPFGTGVEKAAVISFDGNTIKVLRCRYSRPRRMRNAAQPDDEP